MLVYLSVMVLCSILLYAMRDEEKKVRPLAFVFGIIWLMISLQEGWGGDFMSYYTHYDGIKMLSFKDLLEDESHGEIGYKILLWIMPNYHTWFVVAMGIWCFAMAFFFYHFVPQKAWFFAILFVFFDRAIMMGMISSFSRMAIANVFLVFAMFLVSNGERIWKSALLLFLGFFFHKSVLFMAPLLFIRPKQTKLSYVVWMVVFALLTVFMMLFPSSWIGFVENAITSSDAFSSYETYFDDQAVIQFKGVTLIIMFYWVYLLARQTYNSDMTGQEYLVLKLALVRIAFDLLPAAGMSTRFFYYIDAYFFAGMMVVFSRLPENDVHKWVLAATLLLMFGYLGFHSYAVSDFYKEHWATYNFYF